MSQPEEKTPTTTAGNDAEAREETSTGPVRFVIRPRVALPLLVIVCFVISWSFLFFDYSINYSGVAKSGAVRRMFNMTREDGMPSLFMIMQMTLLATTVWAVWLTVRKRTSSRFRRIGWLILALFFSYLAVDDGAKVHERLGTAYEEVTERNEEALGAGAMEAFPSYAWQVVFMPIFSVMGIFMLVFLWRELGSTLPRALVFVAFGLFATAVFFDFIEGLDPDHEWNLYRILAERNEGIETFTRKQFDRSAYDSLRHFSKTIEECMEMMGMTLLWAVFLGHLMRLAPAVHLQFDDGRQGQ
ncbi:MAG: hypothetical protein ACYTGC_16520 [Planctomycetota bacterium]|jgi:hypothetical protein